MHQLAGIATDMANIAAIGGKSTFNLRNSRPEDSGKLLHQDGIPRRFDQPDD
jgi:hypothetical protein